MKKTDARVRYTKKVLKESFLTLLAQKPVNKITVKEICEMAGLNRATFYTHYSDCYQLLESIEDELVERFSQALEQSDPSDFGAVIEAIYKMIEKNEEACRVLIFGGASLASLERMIDLARTRSIRIWKAYLRQASDQELDMMYDHLSHGLMNVVVAGYGKYSREDVIRFVERIVPVSLSCFG